MMGKSSSTTSPMARATPRSRFDGVTMTAAFARSSASRYDVVATMLPDSTVSDK